MFFHRLKYPIVSYATARVHAGTVATPNENHFSILAAKSINPLRASIFGCAWHTSMLWLT
jgi:hypothetical protein